MSLSKEQIKQAQDLQSTTVAVPEWGGDVIVRSMSVKDRIEFEARQSSNQSQTESMITLVLLTCVDEDGNKLFDDSPEDRALMEGKSPAALIKVFNASIELNILNKDKIDEQAKNS